MPQRFKALSNSPVEAYLKAVTLLSLDNSANLGSSDCLDHGQNVLSIKAEARDSLAVNVDGESWQTCCLLNFHFLHSGHITDYGCNLLCHFVHVLKCSACSEDFDSNLRAHAADELIYTQLNRLRVTKHHTRKCFLELFVECI